jgi:IclR family transcriptional regulator, pca regulon regulatory protein
MARRDASPDFIEAVARGLDVIRAVQPVMSLTAVAGIQSVAAPLRDGEGG